MITDEQIKEMQWQSGIYQLKKGCQNLLDEIERAESEKDITRLKALHFHGQTQFSNYLTDRILFFNVNIRFNSLITSSLYLSSIKCTSTFLSYRD